MRIGLQLESLLVYNKTNFGGINMVLAIISFALEIILITSANAMETTMTRDFAIFMIVILAFCTVSSIGCIFWNSSNIKGGVVKKGVCVTGLVFSIVGAVIGLIFFVTFFGTLSALKA